MSPGLPLVKNLLTPSANGVLVALGLKAAAALAAIQEKTFGSGMKTIFSNE